MARIPTITTEVAARVGRSTAGIPGPQASAEAFGAAAGRGLQAVGRGLDDIGQGVYTLNEKRRLEDVANRVAQADFTARELALRNEAPADGSGYQERVLEEYDVWLDEQAEAIEDDETRQAFVQRMQSQRPGLSSRAAQYEFGTAAQYSEQQTNQSLIALDNRVRLQPDRYDELIAQGVDVINSQVDIPATARASMIDTWQMNSAAARFDGMLESVQSVSDVDMLEAQLRGEGGRAWGEEMSTQDLTRLQSTMNTVRTAIRTQADAQARAAIDSLEERAADVTSLLPREELQAAQTLVAASENPVTIARMARIQRDEEIKRQYRTATPEQMRRARDSTIDAGSAVPPGQRRTLDTAGRDFDIGLEFMTRVAGVGVGEGAPEGWAEIRQGIFGGESGGDYDALFGFSNREGGRFADVRLTDMTINEALEFASPSGEYGQWVSGQVGRVATPMGAYQIVGTTLRAARDGLGLSGDERMTPEMQENLGIWIYQSQGTDAWEGYQGPQSAGEPRISQEFLDRAFATPGIREALAGNESPERVVAAYAANSRQYLQIELRRDPSDEEVYMAHTLGMEAAGELIRAQADGDEAANRQYRELTMEYAQAGPQGGATAGQYARQETLDRMASDAEQRIEDDAMTYAAQVGVITMTGLGEENGWEMRGDEARRVADYYRIPISEMEPFTNAEADALGSAMTAGTADDVLEILTQVQSLGGDLARAGMRQVSELGDVYGYAGGLQLETGATGTASEIVRGQKRIEENPAIRDLIGTTSADLSNAFNTATGAALFDIAPGQRQSIMDAAVAHYVETTVARGGAGQFDGNAFTRSINAVLGGQNGQPAIDTVNGAPTILPPGLTGDMLETAFGAMNVTDWASMSEQRLPPRYVDGAIADPRDLQDEAQLRPIGGGKYRVALDDGTFLVTGRPGQNGRLEAFVFVPNPERVQRVIETAEQQAQAGAGRAMYDSVSPSQSPVITSEELQALFNKYPAFTADENAMQELQNYLDSIE